MRLHDALKKAEAVLREGPHAERARHDAETLLLHAAGLTRAGLLAHGEDELDASQAAAFDALVERRRAGEPIQYITGETEFYGLPLRVTRDVLIPRPETEHLVEKAVELATQFPAPRIVDIGSGSGAIAVALAHALPKAQITSIDVSPAALAVARENATRNQVEIRFLEGDLLGPVASEQFDLVVSNPPYVPETDRGSLAVEVRDYEPGLALFAGADGLAVYRRLIPAAFAALVPGGWLVLEIGYGQADAIRALLAEAGFAQIAFTQDLQSIPRVASAWRS
ncbi:MAG TPA: peptide chain release factor N(5)-glutamine methyltransferase [Terracidiphilus sp.]|nr:peptide chain release factor N(5)-glutamine methyltransferase [Terracidiphilus sp.]